VKDKLKGFWFYFKRALLITAIHAAVLLWGLLFTELDSVAQAVLCIADLLLFFIFLFFLSLWTSASDYKRLKKRENADFLKPPYSVRAKEYAFYRGFFHSGIYSSLLSIFILIAAAANTEWFWAALGFLEPSFNNLLIAVGLFENLETYGKAALFFLTPAILPTLVYGIGYIIGGRRAESRYDAAARSRKRKK